MTKRDDKRAERREAFGQVIDDARFNEAAIAAIRFALETHIGLDHTQLAKELIAGLRAVCDEVSAQLDVKERE